jgi:ABC-type multidrug transport system ATPase subunit
MSGPKISEPLLVDEGGEVNPAAGNPERININKLPKFDLKGKGAEISWTGLNYAVGEKHIISSITGYAPPGELTAIMGPSGAGKTSLLNIIAGRVGNNKTNNISGKVAVDGNVVDPLVFRKRIAYVMQEDALTPTATPREALLFSATLRLGSSVSYADKKEKVENMLEALGLMHCADTLIGSVRIKGISGGEKKRTAIGMELITSPDIVFLDEPTSGLDSYAAYNVVSILKHLAKSGCAVLCTIHQPSSEVFAIFERCILLAKGELLYQGALNKMTEHFGTKGYDCPTNYNPADWVMYVAVVAPVAAVKQDPEARPQQDLRRMPSSIGEKVIERIKTSLCTQIYCLSVREFQSITRNKIGQFIGFFITAVLNAFFGIIFYQAGKANQTYGDAITHFGALTQLAIGAMFGAAQPIMLTFPIERPIFLREYATGSYGKVFFFASRISSLRCFFL